MSSGFSASDAQHDFSRARRARLLSDVARRLRREPDDVGLILPFEEVVDALGRTGQVDRGLQIVPLDAIVGTVDRAVDFDRGFRPTSARLRSRWERIAAAQRRGEALPPISLFQVGDLYFVRDGHHRVSVAKSLGHEDIDAYVTEVTTRLKLGADLRVSQLPLKDHERLFRERVPLDAQRRARIRLSDPWDFGTLAEAVEAWGFRLMQERGHFYERAEVARIWFDEEYVPVSELISSGDLVERGETEADAYLRVAADRYLLLRTHEWSDDVLDRLRQAEQRRYRRRHRLPPRRPRRWPY
ncbi:ParB N-terminal domain-containing protein [Candidatus Solirubrobacter pratensis]|uniref:ParB N-terminal domain-containing protein n=1 Tax=Candidatus Solirubrobacter pratensis TaxID=1298857 RepID=UPI00041894A8|nr:ParB N-terminal domain-containing protein [Candidatus Solirubrobacter pratensis]